ADHYRDNVEATRQLLIAAVASGTRRLVFASSVAAMGAGSPHCLDELATPAPVAAYGRTKLLAEGLVLAERGAGALEGVVVRFPLVYGRGQKGNLDRLLRAIVHGRFPPPPRRANRRSVVHVEDAVEALAIAARHETAAAGRIYLACENEPSSTRAIFDHAREVLGRRAVGWGLPATAWRALGRMGDGAAVLLGRRVGFDSTAVERLLGDAWYSSARIQRELGWRPRRRLNEELPRLVAELAGESISHQEGGGHV
ncbi:MAG: NAD-dependent epimerase/dehydratase family protein, partial [Thermoanaerobaculia bacterium]